MSHQPERKGKDCLNCGADINGRFCHICGQENIIPKQSFLSLTKHFVYDIFHFDGKFFDTVKGLLLKPGKVPKEYAEGKRMKYLDPIRMYLFTSAVFFLVFFATEDVTKMIRSTSTLTLTRVERFTEANKISNQLRNTNDSSLLFQLNLLLDTTKRLDLLPIKKDPKNDSFYISVRNKKYLIDLNRKPKNDSFYISVRNKEYLVTPKIDSSDFESKANNWFERKMEERWKENKTKYGDDESKMLGDLSYDFMHKMPYLLFISLPFFALVLQLLNVRRRKVFYFNDHAVFTLYHYIFVFIILLFFLALSSLKDWTGWSIFSWFGVALMIAWPLYLLLGMKNFYRQGWLKTIGKFLLVNVLGFITVLLLFIVFLFISFIF